MDVFGPLPDSPRRLFAFPHAGGLDAEPTAWSAPADLGVVPVLLPGRGRLRSERPYRAMEPLVEDLAEALPTDVPFAFYGHSLGALVAWELTRELRRRGRPLPFALLVGARGAPHLPDPHPPLGKLPTDAFLEAVEARWGGVPTGLDPELLKAFLQPLRADVLLLERFQPVDEAPLDLPLIALHAEDDDAVAAADVDAWREHTTGSFARHTVSGGHFFHRTTEIPAWVP